MSDETRTYRRHLPHIERSGATYFVTFCQHKAATAHAPLPRDERGFVKDAILSFHPQRWYVHCFTVMLDHVHLLATPRQNVAGQWESVFGILRLLKGRTAYQLNKARGVRGPFWQSESFDRIMRDEKECDECTRYILHNAVKAELVEDPWEYDSFWCDQHMGVGFSPPH